MLASKAEGSRIHRCYGATAIASIPEGKVERKWEKIS
jgi:hypothetical protein